LANIQEIFFLISRKHSGFFMSVRWCSASDLVAVA